MISSPPDEVGGFSKSRIMIARICLPVFLCLTVYCSGSGQQAAIVRQIEEVVVGLHRQQNFNGAVLVGQGDQILLELYLGADRAQPNGSPQSADQVKLHAGSAFNLASVSKQFTATAILLLVEEGKLGLDDPLDKHLSGLPFKGVTIRRLLTHTSGIPEYFEPAQRYFPLNHTITSQDILDLYRKKQPAFDFNPGDRYEYSNTNYVFLALIVEAVSGKSFDSFLSERIFQPLGMKNTRVYHLNLPESPAGRVFGMKRSGGKYFADDLTHFDGIVGDGNVYSTARDLFIWCQSLMDHRLLKKESLQQAWTPVTLNAGSTHPYGFGWGIDQRQPGVVSHTGSWAGFKNWLRLDTRTGFTFVLLESAGNTAARTPIADLLMEKDFTGQNTTLIRNVRVIDGSGNKSFSGGVRIKAGKIAEVGVLDPLPGETIIDGRGQVLAPGFIDTHSHHDWDYESDTGVLPAVSQGITTIIIGQDGGGQFPLADYFPKLEKAPATVNVGSFAGHNTLRHAVLGNEDFRRIATPEEVTKMASLLRKELDAGALGLSTGLEYDPGIFSNTEEVLALAKVAAHAGGRYISHMRSEDIDLESAIEELLYIGREAKIPVQISHFKIGMKGKWGLAPDLIAWLQAARNEGIRVSADIYPYEYWLSTLEVLFPKRDFTNRASAEFALRELAPPEGMLIARYEAQPEYVGQTIAQIAATTGEDPATTYMRLIATANEKKAGEAVIGASMTESDIETLMGWAYTNICSDGYGGGIHPRGYGAFPRFLGRYVRERKVMSLETAVHKMTGLSAENMGLPNRGMIAAGYFADLVLFDPNTVQDRSTTQNPHELSEGIDKVWVNGVLVYENRQVTKARPGMVLKRGQ